MFPQVGAGGQVALIDASQLEQKVDVKGEGEETEITLNEEQLQQLQAGGILTDQDGLQQILASNEDGSQQLIQFVTGEDGTIYQVAGKNEQGTKTMDNPTIAIMDWMRYQRHTYFKWFPFPISSHLQLGQTILIAQGTDGEQQCVYVADDSEGLGIEDASNGVLAVDGSLVGESLTPIKMIQSVRLTKDRIKIVCLSRQSFSQSLGSKCRRATAATAAISR